MPLFFLLLAISVKQDHTPLRNGCSPDADTIAVLPAGAAVTIRFSLSGEATPCYKVAVDQSGTTVEGYLSAPEIDGLESFDQARREAAWLDVTQLMAALPAIAPGLSGQGVVAAATRLIEAQQPSRALELLQPELRKTRDPNLLALAGVAAWRADEPRHALEYWRASLDLRANPDLERIYHRVEKETKGDQSNEKLLGLRVLLRYDSATVPIETARKMLGVLDDEFIRISSELGCNAQERLTAIVQSRDDYRKTVDVAEWNGGQFDGRIRIPVLSGQGVDASTRRVFAHETTHACLAMIGRWPSWLHEGLAQKLSGDTLPPELRQQLSTMAKQGNLPRLENLGQDWSRLDTAHAHLAYAMSLAAVEMFYQSYAQLGIANLLRNPQQLPAITRDLDRLFGM
jgi:hypothetical protein